MTTDINALSRNQLIELVTSKIMEGFDRHFRIFNQYTAHATRFFEEANWQGIQDASKKRIQGYDLRIVETTDALAVIFGDSPSLHDEELWKDIKAKYAKRLKKHLQPKLAESYYNSVFCRIHHRSYFNNNNIFVKSSLAFNDIQITSPVIKSYNCPAKNILEALKKILLDYDFGLPFDDLDRDVRFVLKRYLKTSRYEVSKQTEFRFDVVKRPFYRNKGAYIIGRIITEYGDQPFSIPVLNNEDGSLYLDTLILDNEELNVLFGFTRAYFMVESESPAALVSFIQRLLLRKSRTELYNQIGFQKHGKTQFYREFLEHLENSTDNLCEAPGIEGMVMAVFTLPSFPYVFKLIKDKFPPEKETTAKEIREKYTLVKLHDRVGRMADTLEYSEVALPRSRFTDELYEYLVRVAPSKIYMDGDQVVIKHLYIERRMTPLNIFLQSASPDQVRQAIYDYGDAIKQLIAVNIFPGDMLLKNFGVSSRGRVVFYDYDEIEYLTDVNFRKIPEARTEEDEMSDRPWYHVGPMDVFPEQFLSFVLIKKEYRDPFMERHADLLEASYWQKKQNLIQKGIYQNVFPYPEETRFCNCFEDLLNVD
ncbi:MAG: bifunctional isocitrate dehydrogenase kinase/phosphatase [Agarilytica sp.]